MIHWGLKTQNDRSVQETEQYFFFIYFFTSDPPRSNYPEPVHTTAVVWRIFFLLYGGSQTYKCITVTYLSNGPLRLLIEFVDSVNGPFER